jgi:hypothetical protein
MDKHSFEVQQELLNGQIRVEKLRGLKSEVDIAKSDADVKQHHSSQSKVKVQIALTESTTEGIRLNQVKAGQRLEQLKLAVANQDVAQGTRKNSLRQSVLDVEYNALETDLSTAKAMLQQRKDLLKAQGVLNG